jgi:hypothetical protein
MEDRLQLDFAVHALAMECEGVSAIFGAQVRVAREGGDSLGDVAWVCGVHAEPPTMSGHEGEQGWIIRTNDRQPGGHVFVKFVRGTELFVEGSGGTRVIEDHADIGGG